MRSDLVLVLDADEVPAKETICFLRAEKAGKPNADVYSFLRVSVAYDYRESRVLSGGTSGPMVRPFLNHSARMFRNGLGIGMFGMIDEVVAYPAGLRFCQSGKKIYHYMDAARLEEKSRYYDRLLKRCLLEEPEHSKAHLWYVKRLVMKRRWTTLKWCLENFPPLNACHHFLVEEAGSIASQLRAHGHEEEARALDSIAAEGKSRLVADPGFEAVPARARHDLFP